MLEVAAQCGGCGCNGYSSNVSVRMDKLELRDLSWSSRSCPILWLSLWWLVTVRTDMLG